jgi:hypothetical protein
MDRDNRHIPPVIESADSRVRRSGRRRFDFSPRQALYYNDHPDAIIEDFDRSEYRAVLRQVERHVIDGLRRRQAARLLRDALSDILRAQPRVLPLTTDRP